MPFSPESEYKHLIDQGGLSPDNAQLFALESLERLYERMQRGQKNSQGVYLWGKVGR